MKTHCILFTQPNLVEMAPNDVRAPEANEICVATAYSCISPGTELRCLAGQQVGAPDFPFIPGYGLAGVVIAAGSATDWSEGDRVFATGNQAAAYNRCWGAHAGHAIVRGSEAVKVPAGVSLRAASAAKLAAIAYHGLTLARPQPHEKVALVGLGAIGRFAAELYRLSGAHVVATDRSEKRRESANQAALQTVIPGDGLVKAFADIFPDGADVVIDATGSGSALPETVSLGRVPPWNDQIHTPTRFVMQGSYASPPPFPYDAAFDRELTIHVPRDCRRADIRAVLALMERKLLDPRTFIEAADGPEDAPALYARLREQPDSLLSATIRWSDAD